MCRFQGSETHKLVGREAGKIRGEPARICGAVSASGRAAEGADVVKVGDECTGE